MWSLNISSVITQYIQCDNSIYPVWSLNTSSVITQYILPSPLLVNPRIIPCLLQSSPSTWSLPTCEYLVADWAVPGDTWPYSHQTPTGVDSTLYLQTTSTDRRYHTAFPFKKCKMFHFHPLNELTMVACYTDNIKIKTFYDLLPEYIYRYTHLFVWPTYNIILKKHYYYSKRWQHYVLSRVPTCSS